MQGIVSTRYPGRAATARATDPPTARSAPSLTPAALASSPVGETWNETTFSQSETFADYVNAGDPTGEPLRPQQAVKVSCRVKGSAVSDGDPWWYRLASPPWNGRY